MTTLFRTPVASTNPTAKKLVRDALLDGANDGVVSLIDLGRSYSFRRQGPPKQGDIVKNLTDRGDQYDAVWDVPAGQVLPFQGGGVHFQYATVKGNQLRVPSGFATQIKNSSPRWYLTCLYVKLPTQAEWDTIGTSLAPLLVYADAADGFVSDPDLVMIAMGRAGSENRIRILRQTALNTMEERFIVATGLYGQVVQIAFWKYINPQAGNAAIQYARVKSATLSPAAVGMTANTDNAADFSGKVAKLGISNPFWNMAAGQFGRSLCDFRLYRFFEEDLTVSGRDPTTVLDADFIRNISRFS